MNPKLKIGLFGIGLDKYWPKFPGLYERLEGYMNLIAYRLNVYDVQLLNIGIVDTPEKVFDTGVMLRKWDVGIIFIYVGTYALSSSVLPIIRNAKVPVILLNPSPGNAKDYDARLDKLSDRNSRTREWLAYCSACSAPEISSIFKRSGNNFYQVTSIIHNEELWNEVDKWIMRFI